MKYPFDEFQNRFNNREKNLIDILLNDNLNKIIIIEKNSIIFIFIYGINYDNNNNLFRLHIERYPKESSTRKHFSKSYIYEDKYYDS